MSLLKRFAELYLNQPMLLSAGLLPELAYPVASWRYAEVVPVAKAPEAPAPAVTRWPPTMTAQQRSRPKAPLWRLAVALA